MNVMTSRQWDTWVEKRQRSWLHGIIIGLACGNSLNAMLRPARSAPETSPLGTCLMESYNLSLSPNEHGNRYRWTSSWTYHCREGSTRSMSASTISQRWHTSSQLP